ncbi:MAG: tRNA (N(6)-L-threonylcarbamoyladenosine(37)-C(2))-methylthiotransferase MtaB [Robiginitomaculum sp.]
MANEAKIITLGCRLNLQESEVMAKHARTVNLTDAVIINTCAVTNEAVRQGRQAIRKTARNNPDAKIIATGCAVQIDPKAFASMDAVSHVLGNAEKMKAESFILKSAVNVGDIMQSPRKKNKRETTVRAERSRAIVQVQNGCDHRCTFCIIPYGRGNSRSVPLPDVVANIQALSAQGFNEIVLTGVDISSWGDDIAGKPKLGALVNAIINKVTTLPRLRLSSIDCAEVDEQLFHLFATEPRLTPYLHLSLQHGDNMILKRMKRRHTREDAIDLCARLRKVRPDMSFGADIIAGFPTETETMFENSIRLVEECGLAWLHVFPYSARQGTPAVKMPQLKGDVIKARAKRLRIAGKKSKTAFLKARASGYDLALIEKNIAGAELARLADFSLVKLAPHNISAGSLRPVRITGYCDEHLLGELT